MEFGEIGPSWLSMAPSILAPIGSAERFWMIKGKGIPDVKLIFALLSLGQVGEATSSSDKGHSKKRVEGGKFQIDLPVGEYTVIPSKEHCVFTPSSLSISIPDPECDLDRDHWDPWDDRDRWEHCNRHPEDEINFTASCSQ